MAERPRPDLDQTREALRRHDERVDEDPAEAEPTADERDEGEASDEEEPGAGP
jgi:hypothetical protein